jgi:citrate lyase subunit beta/citryl-CoA lyase
MLYVHSKTILAAKASGAIQVFGGMSSAIDDIAGLRRTVSRARDLGCFGSIVIHPSHVPVVNQMYLPTAEEVARARTIITAMRGALAAGDAATIADGRMVDIAHGRSALALLHEAASWGVPGAEVVGSFPELD